MAGLAVAFAAHTPDDKPQVVNSMTVEDMSLWQDTDNGIFVFHDNRADTTNDPVPDAWNIYGQPLEFDAVSVYADGGVQVDIDTEDDSNATVSSALDPTTTYVIRLSSGDHAVTVVHEGDIADVKIVPDNADEVREFHGQLAAGSEGTAVVSDVLPEPPEKVVNAMTVEDTSLWANPDDGIFVFHDNRADTTNDPVPDAWNIYGQPLEFDAVKIYADGGVQVDIDTEDDSNATVSSALDPTVRYVIQLFSGDHAVTVVHEGDIADVKIVPDNAGEVGKFHDQLTSGDGGTAVVSDDPTLAEDEPDLVVETAAASDPALPPGATFTLSATVRNAGRATAAATTLRYYRSADATISTSDTPVGTDAVGALAASGTSSESVVVTAPSTPGTHYYGACADPVSGEADTTNNCSVPVPVRVAVTEPPSPTNPDLVVGSPTVSDSSPETRGLFTLSATVTNRGGGSSLSTTLRYYRSADATISTSDTPVGTDAVRALAASGTSSESVALTAPATPGTYYYGACVDAVSGETDTTNNCSASVRVDVEDPPPPPPPAAPAAPSVSLNGTETELEFRFDASFAALERKAYRIRIRQKAQLSDLRTWCFTVTNNHDQEVDATVQGTVGVASFVRPSTAYLVDYRHLGESCSDAAAAPWSETAEFATSGTATGGDFNIDIVFVGQPPASVRSAFDSAASTWERAITLDLADIDFSGHPTSNGCTDGEFDGVVDDLRIYVRVGPMDGPGKVAAASAICTIRQRSGLPVLARVRVDDADTNIGSGLLYRIALHEIAHTLGFGVLWNLVDPSPGGGATPPDTHFPGPNSVAAFNAAGGADYQGGKVPVEDDNTHWRKSVMGSELMTYLIGAGAPFSAVTIQALADLGYSVDDSVADSYTLANINARLAADPDRPARPHCVVHPPTDIEVVPETRPNTVRASIQWK